MGAVQSPITIRRLAPAEIDATSELLAEAFSDNPCYVYMHPRGPTQRRDLQGFFRRYLRWHQEQDLTWVAAEEQGRVLATVTLVPPGGVTWTPIRMLSHWVLPTAFQHGIGMVRRISRTDAEFRQRYLEDTLGLPYWHLHALAVASDARKQGLGMRIVREAMRELGTLVVTRPGPVVLSTQRESNVAFYRRLGFEVTGSLEMCASSTTPGYPSWFMRYTHSLRSALGFSAVPEQKR